MKKWVFIAIAALVSMPVVAVTVLSLSNSFVFKELKVYGDVPPFQLVERMGGEFGKKNLQGKVWVASFIFTHCSSQCPLIASQVQRLQKALRFKENFRLVSISVDPDRDSRAVLAEYAQRLEADPYKWLFLTGKKREIHALVQNGFRLSSEEGGDPGAEVLHSSKLVLVDSRGRIRGYYDANDNAQVTGLLSDARRLLKQTF